MADHLRFMFKLFEILKDCNRNIIKEGYQQFLYLVHSIKITVVTSLAGYKNYLVQEVKVRRTGSLHIYIYTHSLTDVNRNIIL